jgi:hypothetical protein
MEPNNKTIIAGIQNSSSNYYLNSVVQLLCNIPELQSLNHNNDVVYQNFLDTYDEMYDTGVIISQIMKICWIYYHHIS